WEHETLSWWCNSTETKNPFEKIDTLKVYWDQANSTTINWMVPEGIFGLCGKRAYTQLPRNWRGSCTLGIIQPGFSLLPLKKGMSLGGPF
ncbi:ENR1 protein, partial [Jacana jacana]|nr:ENR1 protein [Jacana jacana]NXS95261.1 ENR1 protein [Jacana jacana]